MGQALSECMGDFGNARESAYDRVSRGAPPRVGAPPSHSVAAGAVSSGVVFGGPEVEAAGLSSSDGVLGHCRSHSRSSSTGSGIGASLELSVRAMVRAPSTASLRQRGPTLSEKRGFIVDKLQHSTCSQGALVSKWNHGSGPCSLTNISADAAVAAPPPPLVPDPSAVYDLLDNDDDEECCPTCLESYSDDNPKISPTCGHSFHLQCLCAWNERSGSRFCPICANVLVFEDADILLTP